MSGRRLVRDGVVVDVTLLIVLGLFIVLPVVVAVGKVAVVVRMGTPIRPVLPLTDREIAAVVMRDVVMVVDMDPRWMGVRRLVALPSVRSFSGRWRSGRRRLATDTIVR
jgi:hypothetical protein